MTDAEYVLAHSGFTVAGGMWGAAAWKMHKDKVYSLGQGRTNDFLSEPTDPHAETCVWIYSGPFDQSWNPKQFGEPPLTKSAQIPDFVTYIFPNLYQALHAMGWLMAAEPWNVGETEQLEKAA